VWRDASAQPRAHAESAGKLDRYLDQAAGAALSTSVGATEARLPLGHSAGLVNRQRVNARSWVRISPPPIRYEAKCVGGYSFAAPGALRLMLCLPGRAGGRSAKQHL
jgi:hypothetical protein